MTTTVWTTPSCVQCEMTKKQLTRLNIPFEVKDLSENPEKLEEFKGKGLLQAPIVETAHGIWSGFRLDKIQGLSHSLLRERQNETS